MNQNKNQIYPFKSGAKILFDRGGFEVAYGISEVCGKIRVGMRYNKSMSGKDYPVGRNGTPVYFIISEELDVGFLTTLLNGDKNNDMQILDAIKDLVIRG
ncbi:hypothetical protein CSPB12327_00675 [Campylobacter sp. RM12327]|uniref:hypothetical protein n=1 Tax=Campylobacter sputorum TaxID=206 RepID=UPI000B7743B5|nr:MULTISPECIES: hypothetical protein [Campylobacter]ASM40367.1 hypothetical protein CSPB_1165 [Campylobacter sputorum]MBE7357360.1 hypothetical protein [Campylobacter sp. RM11302]MBF6668670.1 hypothetical protein [Campylobacter sp. RM12327]MBF6674074.1 hypothetical protein [Campylobacter sp. RM13538]MBF6675543.1 hypothetical protein [Campylobacter sp. RM12321]